MGVVQTMLLIRSQVLEQGKRVVNLDRRPPFMRFYPYLLHRRQVQEASVFFVRLNVLFRLLHITANEINVYFGCVRYNLILSCEVLDVFLD